jgi:hypothetical protein
MCACVAILPATGGPCPAQTTPMIHIRATSVHRQGESGRREGEWGGIDDLSVSNFGAPAGASPVVRSMSGSTASKLEDTKFDAKSTTSRGWGHGCHQTI